MTSDEIREAFLRFFGEKQHEVIPGSSLVPHGDPTLLLTTAGMVQIKPYFLGLAVPPSPRLASCQKCFRTTDIDSVGDAKHLTFFEMLGNFSVGDYFKREAIAWAWEFVAERLKIPPQRLWVTIYLDDDEAFNCWREIGFPEERIVRLGEEDNFWGPAGDSGPCGPCSEIHYDFGVESGCGRPECGPDCNCGRFSEIWNLVFTQYDQDRDGKRTLLPKPNIDTGMGLERTAAVMQGVPSIYETDLFLPLVDRICGLTAKEFGKDEVADQAIRIMAEHSRGIAFLIAAGVSPSNEGRGYVLRRILRRACFFGRKLGIEKPFLSEIAEVAIARMGHIYPELVTNQNLIGEVVAVEEEKFTTTLEMGLNSLYPTLQKAIEKAGQFVSSPAFQQVQEAGQKIAKIMSFPEVSRLVRQLRETGEQIQEVMPSPALLQAIGQYQQAAEQIQRIMPDPAFLRALRQYQREAEQIVRAFEQIPEITPSPELLRAIEQLRKTARQIQNFTTISGEEVFKLHDTFGVPKEITGEITGATGAAIDLEGFDAEMEKQRERARAVQKFSGKIDLKGELTVRLIPKPTKFVGYSNSKLKIRSKIRHVLDQDSGNSITLAKEGKKVAIELDKSPFYGEMGGQVADTGKISSNSGRLSVNNTVWSPFGILAEGAIVHLGQVVKGSISVGDTVEAEVDVDRRLDIARNHTATHLLQAALRQVLGSHVQQRGSLVAPARLRFDFSHLTAIGKQQLDEIQHIVNERIRENLPVISKVVPYKQAISEGAIALFDEKYGETVRVLEVGKPPVSAELCGGTHVKSTGEIGLMLITSESSIGTGLRRIEAVAGRGAEEFLGERLGALEAVAEKLRSTPSEVHKAVMGLTAELAAEHKRSASLERELSRNTVKTLLGQTEQVNGITVLVARVPSSSMPALREMGDLLRDRLKSAVIVLGTVYDGKPGFVAMVTPDLLDRGLHAGEIVKEVAGVTGGSGGGKATMAQAGGRDENKLDEALGVVKGLVQKVG